MAHVGFDVGAHDVPNGLHEVVGRGVHDAQRHVKRPEAQYRIDGQRCQVVRAHAGDVTHDHRQHKVAYGGQGRAEQVQQQHGKVGLEIGQKVFEQAQSFTCRTVLAGFRHGKASSIRIFGLCGGSLLSLKGIAKNERVARRDEFWTDLACKRRRLPGWQSRFLQDEDG